MDVVPPSSSSLAASATSSQLRHWLFSLCRSRVEREEHPCIPGFQGGLNFTGKGRTLPLTPPPKPCSRSHLARPCFSTQSSRVSRAMGCLLHSFARLFGLLGFFFFASSDGPFQRISPFLPHVHPNQGKKKHKTKRCFLLGVLALCSFMEELVSPSVQKGF